MNQQIFSDEVLWAWGPFPFTVTMLTSLVTSLLLVGLGAWLARGVRQRPGKTSAVLGRVIFRFVSDLVGESAGYRQPWLETFGGSLFLFIAGSAILGQLPSVSAPTSNLAATTALAVLVFLLVPAAGIRANGIRGYLRHYLEPNPLLLPLHLISELSRTLALTLRLFGNMMSGHLVVALVVALVGVFVPVPLMALDLLIGLLQAYIFTILACVYVGAAVRIKEES